MSEADQSVGGAPKAAEPSRRQGRREATLVYIYIYPDYTADHVHKGVHKAFMPILAFPKLDPLRSFSMTVFGH